jgi:Beta-ketoacyl synthase, N-terminal domain/Phosphopantetheine attachment site
VSGVDKAGVTPIGVIGMGCRLPGGVYSPERLWEALLRGDDLVTEIPPDRWDADEYYGPQPGVLGVDRVGVDASFFDLGGNSLSAMRAIAAINTALVIDLAVPTLFDALSVRSLSQR